MTEAAVIHIAPNISQCGTVLIKARPIVMSVSPLIKKGINPLSVN